MLDPRSLRRAVCLASVLAFVACTNAPSQKTASDDDDSYIPTGSHIKRKTSEGADRAVGTMDAQQARDMMNKPAGAATSGK